METKLSSTEIHKCLTTSITVHSGSQIEIAPLNCTTTIICRLKLDKTNATIAISHESKQKVTNFN